MKNNIGCFKRKFGSSHSVSQRLFCRLSSCRWLVFGVWFSLFLALSQAQASDPVYTAFFSDKALSGYDSVAYFTESKPVQGDKRFMYEYQHAQWFFVSQQNLDVFKGNPNKYAPQYGGYCAWADGANKAFAAGDPKQWSIIDGKLYLNYSTEVKDKWLVDPQGFIAMGDKNWPEMIKD